MREWIANLLHHLADRIGGVDFEARRRLEETANEVLSQLGEQADDQVEEQQRQANLAYEASRGRDAPVHWINTDYYFPTSVRLKRLPEPSLHRCGGKPPHKGAKCPICRKPLLLIADLDANDLRRHYDAPDLLTGHERLPLYHCLVRPDPTIYQLVSDAEIKTIRPTPVAWEESPFEEVPSSLPSGGLEAIPASKEIQRHIKDACRDGPSKLDEEAIKAMLEFVESDDDLFWDLSFSQVGGPLLAYVDPDDRVCPNPECECHKLFNPLGDMGWNKTLKELAVINEDLLPGVKTNCAKIVFEICWMCLTVRASYRVD